MQWLGGDLCVRKVYRRVSCRSRVALVVVPRRLNRFVQARCNGSIVGNSECKYIKIAFIEARDSDSSSNRIATCSSTGKSLVVSKIPSRGRRSFLV